MGYWRELYDQMLADLQSPAFRRFGSYTIAGRTFSYRSMDEFRRLLSWVKGNADLEEGARPYAARVSYAKKGREW